MSLDVSLSRDPHCTHKFLGVFFIGDILDSCDFITQIDTIRNPEIICIAKYRRWNVDILTHVIWWGHMETQNWVNIGSGHGDCLTALLPETMLTYHQRCSVAFFLGQFHRHCARYQMENELENYTIKIMSAKKFQLVHKINFTHCTPVWSYLPALCRMSWIQCWWLISDTDRYTIHNVTLHAYIWYIALVIRFLLYPDNSCLYNVMYDGNGQRLSHFEYRASTIRLAHEAPMMVRFRNRKTSNKRGPNVPTT